MPVVKGLTRRDDLSTACNFSLRASHVDLVDDLTSRLNAAGVRVSRSRLIQFAIEQLAHNEQIRRVLADADNLEPVETP